MKIRKNFLAFAIIIATSVVSNGCAALLGGLAGGLKLDSGPDDLNLSSAPPVPYRAQASNSALEPLDGGKIYGHY